MTENIYETPKSNVDQNHEYKGSPLKGITYGLLISFFGSIIGAFIIGIIFGVYASMKGISEEEYIAMSNSNPIILLLYLIDAAIFYIWGGYILSKTINYKEYKFCFILSITILLLGEALLLIMPELKEDLQLWYMVAGYILTVPAVIFGAWLWVKSKKI